MRQVSERVIKFIVNPASGSGRTRKILPQLVSIAKKLGVNFDLQITKAPEHATELANDIFDDFDVMVAVGGDGTVNEVAAGALRSQKIVGVIPTGNGNDFARALGRLKNLQEYVHRVVSGKVKSIDTGALRIDNRELFFVNGVGVGFDAEVARESLKVRHIKGISRYLYAVVKTLSKYKSSLMKIELAPDPSSGGSGMIEQKTFLIAIGNGLSAGGGFLLTPNAVLDDGLLDTCIVSDVSIPRVLHLLPDVLNGTHGKHHEVTMTKMKRIRIQSETPVSIHRDGEVLLERLNDLAVQIIPGSLKIMA
ncbi:MAG: diacylglycerol kinase family protein [Candidatus Kryptoniota bacterium]